MRRCSYQDLRNREYMAQHVLVDLYWQPRMAVLSWITHSMLACRLCSSNSFLRSGSVCLLTSRVNPVALVLNPHPRLQHHRQRLQVSPTPSTIVLNPLRPLFANLH